MKNTRTPEPNHMCLVALRRLSNAGPLASVWLLPVVYPTVDEPEVLAPREPDNFPPIREEDRLEFFVESPGSIVEHPNPPTQPMHVGERYECGITT